MRVKIFLRRCCFYLRQKKCFFLLILLILVSVFMWPKQHDSYREPLSIIENEPDCLHLYNENTDPTVFEAAESWQIPKDELLNDLQWSHRIELNCHELLEKPSYFIQSTNNQAEKQFPIAFSILVFKNANQVERLLRTIYRPWNYYCIHIDLKSSDEFVQAVSQLVNCLGKKHGNIINTANRLNVEWGEFSVLKADINCMEELYNKFTDWKYLINLTGQEFPLKTNRELVAILKSFKGANNVDGTYQRRDEHRLSSMKIPIPVVWFKGSVHVTVNRDFIQYVLQSPVSKLLLNALTKADVPDEQFFSTLNYNTNLRIPGSFIGDPDDYYKFGEHVSFFVTRFKNRGEYSCISAETVRGLCIWGAGDLPKLVSVPHLFANKFYEDFQPITLRCLEKWYYAKVEKENSLDKISINTSFYGTMPFVKYRLK